MANTTDFRLMGATGFSRVADIRGLFGILDTVRDRMAKARVYRTTLNELESLSKRELDDMGLNQFTLKTIAYESAYGKN